MCSYFLLRRGSDVDSVCCRLSINSGRRTCIERAADMFVFIPTEALSLPGSSVTEGRLLRSAIRPNLIYYRR